MEKKKFTQHSPEGKESHNRKCDQKLDHQNGVHLKEGNDLL